MKWVLKLFSRGLQFIKTHFSQFSLNLTINQILCPKSSKLAAALLPLPPNSSNLNWSVVST